MLQRPMIAAAVLALLIGVGPLAPPPPGDAVPAIPEEPEALMLPEAPTYQAVAADVDGDGVRDVVRLVEGEQDAIDIEVWRFGDGAWRQLGEPVNAVPGRPTQTQGSMVYSGSPARLIVRRIDGVERATLVRQPRFEEPGLHVACCLLIDDVTMVDGVPGLAAVAERGGSADAVLAIDMDGDGTDELLVTRGRAPLGDTAFPTDALVLRWAGEAFADPVPTDLPVGSGASPFVLGDSDGVPGDEAAFIGAQSRLHRISLRAGDELVAESGRLGTLDALAVPLDDERGIAIVSRVSGLAVQSWPRDEPMGQPMPARTLDNGDLLGVVALRGEDRLLVRAASVETLQVLTLPTLVELGRSVIRSPAAGTLTAGPTQPYVGPIPGGIGGEPAIVYAGHLIPSEDLPGAAFATEGRALQATLAGAVPVGLAGPEAGWLVLWHRALPDTVPSPVGGRLDAPVAQAGSGVSLVPLDVARTPELDDGELTPPTTGAIADRREVIVGPAGFTAHVEAPPGSRIYLSTAGTEPTIADVRVVPSAGSVEVPIMPPPDVGSGRSYRASLAVTTPAGHGYLARWDVRVLSASPPLTVRTDTPLGSSAVVVSGATDPGTTVSVAGHPASVDPEGGFRAEVSLPPWPTGIEVVVTDLLGNQARTTIAGVGYFDYRALPWIAIAVVLVSIAGVATYLRVPHAGVEPVTADDDATLEEIEPE